MLRKITYVASIAAVGGLLLRRTGLWSSGMPLPLADADGRRLPGSVSEKTCVDINGVRQGMFLQSVDVTNPVLLYLHGGAPEFFLTERYPTGLEKVFTVAWWDRRGAGLWYDARIPPQKITLEQYLADTLAVTDYLRKRFGQKKVYLMAHSGGTFFGLQAAAHAPERFHAYVGMSQMVRQLESERMAYEYMVARFRERGDLRMLRKLEAAPVTMADGTPDAYLSVRDKAMHRLGVGTMHDMHSVITGVFWPSITSRQYTVGEKVRLWRGKFTTGVMPRWEQILATDLSEQVQKVDVPLYFLHGVHDYTCCLSLAHEYFERVRAPVKGFYTFDHSAHSPLYEEPEKVRRILSEDVLSGTNKLADPA
ncbi:MAG TPA: alpha/beta hydrolase [Vicinamibacterales bacterium]|nr:alpha/beta hydrolase [Vicinamibacterales bacterium]